MTDRFDLEQQILECWKVTTDIQTMLDYGQSDLENNLKSLAKVYDLQFEKLWAIFEQMCASRQFVSMSSESV